MKRRLTSLCGDCAEDVCVHIAAAVVATFLRDLLWGGIGGLLAPLLMMQMCVPGFSFGR